MPAKATAKPQTDETQARLEAAIEELTHRAEKIIQDGVAALRNHAGDYGDIASEQVDHAKQYISTQARERPMTTVMTALGVGVFVGLLLGGRR